MKKIYMNPNTIEMHLNMQFQLLAGSRCTYDLTVDVENASDETKDGGWNSRGGFWSDED